MVLGDARAPVRGRTVGARALFDAANVFAVDRGVIGLVQFNVEGLTKEGLKCYGFDHRLSISNADEDYKPGVDRFGLYPR